MYFLTAIPCTSGGRNRNILPKSTILIKKRHSLMKHSLEFRLSTNGPRQWLLIDSETINYRHLPLIM